MPKFNQRRHFEHDSLDFPQTNDRNKTNLVMGGHSKIHFQERLSETESFKSSIQAVEQPARLDTDIHRRAKKLVQSKNCSRTIDEYRSLEKRHIPSPLSISSSGLPSVDWKTKRVVLDENGVTAKVRSSGELDMQVVMNRKQRAALMLTDPRGRAEASRNFFKSEGLVPGSTIRQQRKVRRRENDIEDEAQEAYESKIAMDALKRQMKINSINKALVNELTNPSTFRGQEQSSWEEKTGNMMCPVKVAK